VAQEADKQQLIEIEKAFREHANPGPAGGCGHGAISLHVLSASAGSSCRGKFAEQFQSFWPGNAGVGDALSIQQGFPFGQFLRASDQVALKHYAKDIPAPTGEL